MKISLLFKIIFLTTCLNHISYATHPKNIIMCDLNDTFTAYNAVDPEKTHEVVKYQLVAQNTFLRNNPSVSIEGYIKKTITDKTRQRETYGRLPEYMDTLLTQGLISKDTLDLVHPLREKYSKALEKANKPKNGGLFPSFFNFIEYILSINPEPVIIFQSFGDELPLALKMTAQRFKGRVKVEDEIGTFDGQHHLSYKNKTYQTPEEIEGLLRPGTVMGWKNYYEITKRGGRKFLIFQDKREGFTTSHFVDDNAKLFARVFYNGRLLPKKEGLLFAEPYIHTVNTAKALTDKNYFVDLLQNQFSVLSYNIQLSGLDEPPHLWSDRARPVISKLHQYDMLILQEVSHTQLQNIQQAMPRYKFISINSVTGKPLTEKAVDTVEGMTIGFNQNIFKSVSEHVTWLSDTPQEPSQNWGVWRTSFPKLLQRVVLIHTSSQKEIVVYNSHFCHEEDPMNYINPRLKAAQMEISQITQDLKRGFLIISAGDRNTHLPRDQEVLDLYQQITELKDADDHRQGLKTTFIGFENHPRLNPVVDGKFEKEMNLDKLYYSKELSLVQSVVRSGAYAASGELIDTSPTQAPSQKRFYGSDHAPVACFFRIVKKLKE